MAAAGSSTNLPWVARHLPRCLALHRLGGGLEGDDGEFSAPLFTCREVSLRAALVAGSGDGALVLGAELPLEPLGALSLPEEHRKQHDNDHDDKDRDQ